MNAPISGVIAALPTPFEDSGRIDEKALLHLVDYLSLREIAGLALLTEAAEDPLLSPEERRSVLTSVSRAAGEKKAIWVNVSAPATRDAVELAKHAQAKGAEGVLLGPYRVPGLGYRELYRHLDRLAKSVELPVLLVIRPENAADALAPEEIATLSKHPALRGVVLPEAGAEAIEAWAEKMKKRGGVVLSGSSLSFSAPHRAGACGSICGMAVVAPEQAVRLFDAIRAGHSEAVLKMERMFQPAVEMLGPPRRPGALDGVQRLATKLAKRSLEGSQIQPSFPFALLKEALRLQGHPIKSRVRAPYEQVTGDVSERLKTALRISELIT